MQHVFMTTAVAALLVLVSGGRDTALAEDAAAPAVAPVNDGTQATPPAAAETLPLDASGARNPFPNEGTLYDTFRDVAGELRCPTCTGLSILDSDATFSLQIRDLVKEKVKAGESKDKILEYFTERYGAWILRAPPTKGFNAFAWLFPIVLLVLGPPLVYVFVWRKRRVVSTMGVRSTEEIAQEMHAALATLRAVKPKG